MDNVIGEHIKLKFILFRKSTWQIQIFVVYYKAEFKKNSPNLNLPIILSERNIERWKLICLTCVNINIAGSPQVIWESVFRRAHYVQI